MKLAAFNPDSVFHVNKIRSIKDNERNMTKNTQNLVSIFATENLLLLDLPIS